MLTARDDDEDIVIGWADDYLVKPFQMAVFWRVFGVVSRRQKPIEQDRGKSFIVK